MHTADACGHAAIGRTYPMDWDNLRYFLELARAGTLVGAARRLAVDHTTVARRIQALEKQLGSALFAREAAGHRLTEAGRALQPQAEAMEAAFLAVEKAAPGARKGLHGLVRVGTTEGLGNLILAPQLARLFRQDKKAYQYLNESSIAFPDRQQFIDILKGVGYSDTFFKPLSLGICCIYCGRKPQG